MSKPTNLCKDCKYFKINHLNVNAYSKCKHPKLSAIDLVSGKANYQYADLARDIDRYCGTAGRYFEQKIGIFTKIKNWFSSLWRVNG